MKITFIFDVPGCSGMFRHVPECSGMFHVPGFIDALFLFVVCVTRAVYFHVNVTCFATKHLKFDSHYSNYNRLLLLICF